MSEVETGLKPNQPVAAGSIGADGILIETIPYILVGDAGANKRKRQVPGIAVTPQTIRIVKQLIEYVKSL